MEIIYTIRMPYRTDNAVIEVFGSHEEGRYDWRLVVDGKVERKTNQRYFVAEVALRDALVELVK